MIVLYSLSNYAVSLHLSQTQGSVVTAMVNLGTFVGRPAFGIASDRLGRIEVAAGAALFNFFVCFAIWIPCNSYGLLVFFAFVAGLTVGTFWMVSRRTLFRIETLTASDCWSTVRRGRWTERGSIASVAMLAVDCSANGIR